MSDLETFQKETRAWLEKNCPVEMREPIKGDDDMCWGGRGFKFQSEAQKLWLERMAAKGWTTPTWPKEYGGGRRKNKSICQRSCAGKSGGAKGIQNQAPVQISQLLPRNAKIKAIIF